jgi:hypothetical protein
LRIRNAIKALNVSEPAHPAAVHKLLHFYVSGTPSIDKPETSDERTLSR